MRTSTAAWAAALAVMSMSGPFTTAKAAPARVVDPERPRPFLARLRRRQGFNDSDSDPSGAGVSVPLLGGSSSTTSDPRGDATSAPDPTPSDSKSDPTPLVNSILGQSDTTTSPRVPLTTSTTEPADTRPSPQSSDSGPDPVGSLLSTVLDPTPDPKPTPDPTPTRTPLAPTSSDGPGRDTNPVGSLLSTVLDPTPDTTPTHTPLAPTSSDGPGGDSNPVGSLLSTVLQPTVDLTSTPTPPAQTESGGSDRDSTTTAEPDNDPLLQSITGQLSNILPTASGSGTAVIGITTVLHQTTNLPTLPGTGNPGPDSTNSGPENTNTGLLSNLNPSGLPTGNILPSISVPAVKSGRPPVGTGLSDLPGTVVPSVVSSVQSAVTDPTGIVGTGTGLPGTAITSALSSVESAVTDPTGIVGTATGLPGTIIPSVTVPDPTGIVGTGTGLPGTLIPSVNVPDPTGIVGTGSVLPTGTGTGGLPIPSVPTSPLSDVTVPNPTGIVGTGSVIPTTILPTVTGTGGLTIPTITGTGILTTPTVTGTGGIIPSVRPDTTPVQSDVTVTGDSITLNPSRTPESVAPSATGGTGNSSPAGSTFTATVDGTSVVVTVPDNSASGTGVTATPDIASTASTASAPVVTASNETESTKPSEASQTEVPSQTATTNDTTPAQTSTETASPSVRPTAPASTTPRLPSANPTSEQPQVSIVATGTDTQTTLSLPTTWSFAPSPSNTDTSTTGAIASATTATDTSGGLPTTMPRLVQPANGMPVAPSNFTLVQVGFNFGLNYPFVVGKPESAMQIFAYLPKGIAFGLNIGHENVLMNALMPYDTSQTLGYITTLAQVYIPSDLVNELQLHLHIPTSPVYLNPSAPVGDLMNMVNPTIPILPGAAMDGYSSSSAYNPAATTRAGEGDGAPIGGDSGSAKKVSGASVGIGLGAIGGAAVYAAAMIYVARRYRQKRKGHQRASSVPTAGEMTQRSSGGMGGLFMSGANGRNSPRTLVTNSGGRNSRTSNNSSNGRSIREQGISAPLMSENSLGWN